MFYSNLVGVCFAVVYCFDGVFSGILCYFDFGNSITVGFDRGCFAIDCKLSNCTLCPYPYCLDGDTKEDADEVIKAHKQIQRTKTEKERRREAWRGTRRRWRASRKRARPRWPDGARRRRRDAPPRTRLT